MWCIGKYRTCANLIRDIKPENILIDSGDVRDFMIKITDFGFACFFNPQEGLEEVLGSPLYMAPEIVEERKYDERVDIWSIGVIGHILLSGRPPFKGKTKDDIFKSIRQDELNLETIQWRKLSEGARDFVKKSLIKDYRLRPNAEELLHHPWLEKMVANPSLG